MYLSHMYLVLYIFIYNVMLYKISIKLSLINLTIKINK